MKENNSLIWHVVCIVVKISLYTNIRTHGFSETFMVLGECAQVPQIPLRAPRTIKCFWNGWEYISDSHFKNVHFDFLSRKNIFLFVSFKKKNKKKFVKFLKNFFDPRWPRMTSSDSYSIKLKKTFKISPKSLMNVV